MNRLLGQSCYLSGSIDFSPDKGKGWRDEITPFIEGMGVKVYDPLNHHKNFNIREDIDEIKRPYMSKLLKEGRYDELQKEMKELVHLDLRSIDLSSFIICNYDTSIHMCGTIEEICIASKQVKPILLMCKNGKNKLPSWLYGRLNHEYFFESWDSLKHYLNDINSNPDYKFTQADDKRWLFFAGDHMHNNIIKPESEPERNSDGDTIEYMYKMWRKGYSIEWYQVAGSLEGEWVSFNIKDECFNGNDQITEDWEDVNHIRIASKHSDIFDSSSMDRKTWCDSVIKKERIIKRFRLSDGRVDYFDAKDKDTNQYTTIGYDFAKVGYLDVNEDRSWYGFEFKSIPVEQYYTEVIYKERYPCIYSDCGWCYKPNTKYQNGCVGLLKCDYMHKCVCCHTIGCETRISKDKMLDIKTLLRHCKRSQEQAVEVMEAISRSKKDK